MKLDWEKKSTNSVGNKSTNTSTSKTGEKQTTISNFGTEYFGTKSTELRKSTNTNVKQSTKSTEIYESTEKKYPTKI